MTALIGNRNRTLNMSTRWKGTWIKDDDDDDNGNDNDSTLIRTVR